MVNEFLLLELDTTYKTFIKSDHHTRRIIIDKGRYETYLVNGILLFTDMMIRGNVMTSGDFFLNNNKLYLTEKDMKKDRNGIMSTPKEMLKVPYKFNTLFAFSSSRRISIKKDELEKLNEVSETFKDKFLQLLSINIPNYYDVVANNYIGPLQFKHYKEDEQVKWNRSTEDSSIVELFTVVVHESIHKNNMNNTSKVLLPSIESIEIEKTEVIPTIEMVSFFDSTCFVDNIFRFNLYCNSSSSSSSTFGVYGMIDEFSAYYHETNVAYLMYQQFKVQPNFANTFRKDLLSSMFAYYEFNLFMGGYLSYVKTNNPIIYNKIVTNKNFCLAYAKIDDDYGGLAKLIEKEFANDDFLNNINEDCLISTKKDLQQFLPELEVLKNNVIANK